MLVLFETSAGFALFKVLDEAKVKECKDLHKDFSSLEKANAMVQLKSFRRFKDTTDALSATTALVESKLSKGLSRFLKKAIVKEGLKDKLAIADKALGKTIRDKLGIRCVHHDGVNELMRGIRAQLQGLLDGVDQNDLSAMSLGLSHSLSRYQLKFSPDKVDTMIVQAIGFLDDLDKELNNYAMRLREWYGWHFPELPKIVTDNKMFARTVLQLGSRSLVESADLDSVLPEDLVEEVKAAARVSMGTEISEEDTLNIHSLCHQVIAIADNRETLFDYLKNRMQAIAPNLTVLVGELVGARLIAHAGSLLNLAKHPASTVQILGAEKALFRALKTKHNTPKYGLLYHASLIGQTSAKNKGKVARMLAAKASLATRVDALGDTADDEEEHELFAIEHKAKVEARMRQMEGKSMYRISGTAKSSGKSKPSAASSSSSVRYNQSADVQMDVEDDTKTSVKKKSGKKKRKKIEESGDEQESSEEEAPKKKKKRSSSKSSSSSKKSKK
eukprot:CAMPEP_0177650936 /NCGR_PEP_ID=MMETSP0447-20121125/12238_1 /TAXON_ID=0 /ORGANISM="Stygamoeba regulata, Strain BSH-02190019" /LENGTH=501 /DNA_ID=CAMNT_0019153899 /DNA_START=197 /DNA_END=1702 /DNA_ORIENTATION=-